ncbi:unnamed protein product [Prunus brigantina]
MLHDPKCRFDYPLASIRLHHADLFSHQADLFSLDWHSGTYPINTKLKTTTILVIASFTPYIIRPSLSEQRAGAPPKIHHQHHH